MFAQTASADTTEQYKEQRVLKRKRITHKKFTYTRHKQGKENALQHFQYNDTHMNINKSYYILVSERRSGLEKTYTTHPKEPKKTKYI
jgi:hypothetical protein